MCGRYYIEDSPELAPFVEAMNRSPLLARFEGEKTIGYGEVRPMNVAPVIAANKRGMPAVFPMQWGFTGRSLLINARVETAAEKSAFRDAWKAHRCVIPASYYYEWEHIITKTGRKQKGTRYALRPMDADITWLCGLYRIEEGLPHFVILTTEPAVGIRFIHDRMPLMLPRESARQWIRPDTDAKSLLPNAATDIVYHPSEESRTGQLVSSSTGIQT